jgi:hypothetical protein
MEASNLQQLFFATIRNAIPANISMVDEVAEILKLSYDSIYRRVRGEKPITLDELKILCDHFHISLDEVLQLNNDSVVFKAPGINGNVDFSNYWTGMLAELTYFNSFKERQMYYLCKDLPIWYFFHFPEIAAFKMFCWVKTIQNNPAYTHKIFSIAEYRFDEQYLLGQQILREYNKIPCVELWSYESINSTINQIQYYRDAQLFATKEDFDQVLLSFKKVLFHLREQAESGKKFMPGTSAELSVNRYDLYINEVLLGNNTTLISLDNILNCYINYNGLNYFKTRDARFTKKLMDHFNTLISRSTYISNTGEKFRMSYFMALEDKINRTLQHT